MFQINYIVFEMFRTSKCSSSGIIVNAVLWYFFHAELIIKDCKGKGHPITGHPGPRGGVEV
jgi:hypothetical protein